jgi:succinate dehydrogenase subunit C
MSDQPAYTEYHPRWYRRRMATSWWLQRRTYVAFILRELSSLFVAWSVVYLLLLVHAVSQGDLRYRRFMSWSASPVVLVVNLVSLFFLLYHAITWFNLAPQALVVRFRGRRVPGSWIAISNYAAWALVSALVAWLLQGG